MRPTTCPTCGSHSRTVFMWAVNKHHAITRLSCVPDRFDPWHGDGRKAA